MSVSTSSDIFKFVSLRSPERIDYGKDNVNYIRDNRITPLPYSPDEAHDINQDESRFDAEKVGDILHFVFQRIKVSLPAVTTLTEAKSKNDMIVEDVKSLKGGLVEKIEYNYPHIDGFVTVIKKHLIRFDKQELILELNEIIKKHFNYSGIDEYVQKNSDNNMSAFCMDYYNLFDQLYVLYVCKRIYPINLEYVIDGLRALHVILWLNIESESSKSVDVKNSGSVGNNLSYCSRQILEQSGQIEPIQITNEMLIQLFNATPLINQILSCLISYYKPFNEIRPIGIGDLLVVKQFLCKYEAGEIAHIENVLKGENRDRSHRRLDRTEDILTSFNEKVEDTEKDLQTTERYELNRETESTIKSDLNAELSTTVTGTYGTINFTASAGIAYSRSTSESQKNANNFSKDVVDRSLTKIKKTVREERTTKKLTELEEINKHGFQNGPGEKNISGIYRWLDKHYKAQVFNYGKRMMFEFVIPEPAAFIMKAFDISKKNADISEIPTKPLFPRIEISKIDDALVESYSELYDLQDTDPEPEKKVIAVRSVPIQKTHSDTEFDGTRDQVIDIPPGYEVYSAEVTGSTHRGDPKYSGLFVAVGGMVKNLYPNGTNDYHDIDENYDASGFTKIREKTSIAILYYGLKKFSLNVILNCKLTSEKHREWQIKMYDRIMNAYNKVLAEYESKLTEYNAQLSSYNESQRTVIQGRNPGINQEIIKTELKKHCITMITKQFDVDKSDDEDFNAMQSRIVTMHVDSTDETKLKDPNLMTGMTLFTIKPSDKVVVTNPRYLITGYVYTDQVPGTVPLYRLSRQSSGTDSMDLFYTADATEHANALGMYHYQDEEKGYIYKDQVPGTVPLYRLSRLEGQHFYTTNASERDTTVTILKYKYEGITGYVNANPIHEIMIPAINIDESKAEAKSIQFLEQAFEWPQITYILYPYFWGKMPEKWIDAQKYFDEEDPIYRKFLQAGSVRVLIAVRPVYETAVLHYLCTREPWNGGPAPGIDNPMYIPIHEELRSQQDDLYGANPYGTPWEVIVPTSLVYLQDDSNLPKFDCNPPRPLTDPSAGHRIRVILEKILVVDDSDPSLKGAGELDFEIKIFTNNYGGKASKIRIPESGHYSISSGQTLEINSTIFEDVVIDHLAIRINAMERDNVDPDDNLGSYVRIFNGDPNSWLARYAPNDEIIDPEDLRYWKIYYRIEKF